MGAFESSWYFKTIYFCIVIYMGLLLPIDCKIDVKNETKLLITLEIPVKLTKFMMSGGTEKKRHQPKYAEAIL